MSMLLVRNGRSSQELGVDVVGGWRYHVEVSTFGYVSLLTYGISLCIETYFGDLIV